MVSTRIKRSSLRDAYDAAVDAGISLYEQLRSYETAARAAVSAGQIISSVSASNGAVSRSVSYSIPSPTLLEGMTPSGVLEMWSELVDLHDTAEAYLGGSPSDEQIKNEMMGLLVAARELQPSSFLGVGHPQ